MEIERRRCDRKNNPVEIEPLEFVVKAASIVGEWNTWHSLQGR